MYYLYFLLLIYSGHVFKSLVHFELKANSSLVSLFCMRLSVFFQHHLMKRLSFLYGRFLASLLKIIFPYTCAITSGLPILFHWCVILKARKVKGKINEGDYIKLKSSCTANAIINKTKWQPTEWQKIVLNRSDKELITKI